MTRVWDSTNGMVDIGTLDGDLILAHGINNAGQVVGEYLTSDGIQRAFIWDNINGMVDLGLDFGTACAINGTGQVVGGAESAFIWDSTNGVTYLDSLGKTAVARAINEVGQVAGNVFKEDGIVSRAVLWDSDNGVIDLGTLGRDTSQAWGINDFGQVVGNAIDHSLYGSGVAPFLWDSQNGMVNLNSLLSVNSSWAEISSVYDINNRGQIVGQGYVSGDSGTHAFLITPVPQPQTYYVDDDAPDDPVHGDPSSSDPLEDGSIVHPFDAIQEAIDAAYDGDTVLVADGIYTGQGNRDIEVSTKGITIRSLNGPENCIIDCNATKDEPYYGFYFHDNEDSNSILSGFTITKGYSWSVIGGVGITSRGSRLTISDCNIRGNKVFGSRSGFSSGISLIEGIYFINNCTITENATKTGVLDCGALYARSSGNGQITINNCTITNNNTVGIRCENSGLMITDCNISGNTSGGIYCEDGNSTITDCKISDNGLYLF